VRQLIPAPGFHFFGKKNDMDHCPPNIDVQSKKSILWVTTTKLPCYKSIPFIAYKPFGTVLSENIADIASGRSVM